MKDLPIEKPAWAESVPAGSQEPLGMVSLVDRVARLAWMECADGATRRDLAASAAAKTETDAPKETG